MSKNVLILSSSPRHGGNSERLCSRFAQGAQEAGHQAEIIHLREKKIGYCLACDACQTNGGRCIQKDDMTMILNKMLEADVIAMATPVYFYTLSAQLKTLIDRVYARYTSLTGKEMYFFLTAGDDNISAMEGTVESFRGFISCLDGAEEMGIIYGVGVNDKGDIEETAEMDQAYEMGKAL